MIKLFFYDLETTGTKHWQHCIHQIAGAVVTGESLKSEFTVSEYIDIRLAPHPQAKIDPEALKVSGLTVEDIQAYPDWKTGYGQLITLLDKHVNPYEPADKLHLVGYNNLGFDNPFLRNLFTLANNNGFNAYFYSNSIDVMALATQYLLESRHQMPNFKLQRLAITLGIEVDKTKTHDARYDTNLLIHIYSKVTGIRINIPEELPDWMN